MNAITDCRAAGLNAMRCPKSAAAGHARKRKSGSCLLGECRFWCMPGDYRVSTALSLRYGASNEIPPAWSTTRREKTLDALVQSEYDALEFEALAYDEEMRKSGHLIVASGPFNQFSPLRRCGPGWARCA